MCSSTALTHASIPSSTIILTTVSTTHLLFSCFSLCILLPEVGQHPTSCNDHISFASTYIYPAFLPCDLPRLRLFLLLVVFAPSLFNVFVFSFRSVPACRFVFL